MGGGGYYSGRSNKLFFFFFPFQSFFLSSNACLSYQPVQVCFFWGGRTKKQLAFHLRGEVLFLFVV